MGVDIVMTTKKELEAEVARLTEASKQLAEMLREKIEESTRLEDELTAHKLARDESELCGR